MMAYIKLDDALKVCSDCEEWYADINDQCGSMIANNIYQEIANLSIADVVEVVRCKKCTHKIDYKGSVMCKRNAYIIALEFGDEWCGLTATENDHFCSYGERKDT